MLKLRRSFYSPQHSREKSRKKGKIVEGKVGRKARREGD